MCASKFAESVLRTIDREIVPLCKDCGGDWNFYGYRVLKRITPGRLLWRTAVFKSRRPFMQPSLKVIWQDMKSLQGWAKKMRKWT